MADLFACMVAALQGLLTLVQAREAAGSDLIFRNCAAQHLSDVRLGAEAGLRDGDVTGVTVAAVAHAGAEVDAAVELLAADVVAVDDGAALDRLFRFTAWAGSENL